MTTESVKFLIEAEDKATAKIRNVTEDIERQAKQVKEVGSKAKASTELVGSLATAMGGSGVGVFAGEIAQLTERISAFTEVANSGGAAVLAMKAGIAAAAGVMSFKFGQAIGNQINQTEKWGEELDSAIAKMKELDQTAIGLSRKKFELQLLEIGSDPEREAERRKAAIAKIEADIKGLNTAISGSVAQIEQYNLAFFGARLAGNLPLIAAAEAQIESDERLLEEKQRQLQIINEINTADGQKREKIQQEMAERQKLVELEKQAESIGKSKLELEIQQANEIVKSNEGRQRAAELIQKRIAAEKAIKVGEEQERQRQALARQERAAKERAVNMNRSLIQQLKLQVVALKEGKQAAEAMKLELQGFSAADALKITNLREQIENLSKSEISSSVDINSPGTNINKNLRLNSGSQESPQLKIVQQGETANRSRKNQEKLLGQIIQVLNRIDANENVKLHVVG